MTDGSMKPVRSLAPAIVPGRWAAHWFCGVGPIAGAVLGAVVCERLRPASVPPGIGRRPLGVEGPIGPASGVADG